MSKHRPIHLIAATTVILIIAACTRRGTTEPQPQQVVKIGTILDLTGPAASFGEMQKQGIQLALDDIKADDPTTTLDVVIQDSRLDPKLAIAAANKLVDTDHVVAITSITGSSIALTVAPLANRHKVPILDSLSSAGALTTQGGPYYFRIQPPDDYAGREIVRWAHENGAATAATVYAESDWGQGLRDAIGTSAKQAGIALVAQEPAKPGDTDFRALIARLRNKQPQVIFLVAHPKEAGLFLKQADEANLKTPVYGSDSLSTAEVTTAAQNAVDGVRFVLAAEGTGERLAAFRQRFRAKFGADPSANSIRPYDALRILVFVIKTNGNTREDIKRGLEHLKPYQGISGTIAFDTNGDLLNPSYDRFTYHGAKYEKVQ